MNTGGILRTGSDQASVGVAEAGIPTLVPPTQMPIVRTDPMEFLDGGEIRPRTSNINVASPYAGYRPGTLNETRSMASGPGTLNETRFMAPPVRQAPAFSAGPGTLNETRSMASGKGVAGQPMQFQSYQRGGEVKAPAIPGVESEEDRQIVMDAIMALRGQSENPDAAVRRFIVRFGPQAFEQLMESEASGEIDDTAQRISSGQGGVVNAPGGPEDDMMPAVQPGATAALSDGEFVVPQEMTAAIGGGDQNKGLAALESMRRQVV